MGKDLMERWLSGQRHSLGKRAGSEMAPQGSNPCLSANFGDMPEWFKGRDC